MSNQAEIEGIDEILRALESLPSKVGRKVLYDANREILSRNVLPGLRASLPYSARTRRGIKIVKARGTDSGVYIGVSSDAFYLRFLEKGTKRRELRKNNANRGSINPARPFAIPTIEDKANAVLQAVAREYPEMIVLAIAKQLKKYKIQRR